MASQNNNLSRNDVLDYFNLLGKALADKGIISEIAIYGGGAIALQYDFRESSQDIDYLPISQDTSILREVAKEVGQQALLSDDWFNKAVEDVIIEPHHSFYGDFPQASPGLRVFVAEPGYILAMKMMSMRSSMDSNDPFDVWHLMKEAGISTKEEVVSLVASFFPGKDLPTRNTLIIDDMLAALNNGQAFDKQLGI